MKRKNVLTIAIGMMSILFSCQTGTDEFDDSNLYSSKQRVVEDAGPSSYFRDDINNYTYVNKKLTIENPEIADVFGNIILPNDQLIEGNEYTVGFRKPVGFEFVISSGDNFEVVSQRQEKNLSVFTIIVKDGSIEKLYASVTPVYSDNGEKKRLKSSNFLLPN